MESVPFIEWALSNLNYFTITLLMTIESSFIPFPSEVVIPPAAYIAATSGELNVYLVVLFGTIGAIFGALINYYLAFWLGRPIVYRFARSRVGAFLLLSEESIHKAEQYFVKHGSVSTFIGRLVPGIRQLISIPAGLAKMKIAPFILFTALGAGLWNVILAAIGWYLAAIVPEEELMTYVNKYSHEIGMVILILVALALGYMIFRSATRKKVKTVDEVADELDNSKE